MIRSYCLETADSWAHHVFDWMNSHDVGEAYYPSASHNNIGDEDTRRSSRRSVRLEAVYIKQVDTGNNSIRVHMTIGIFAALP